MKGTKKQYPARGFHQIHYHAKKTIYSVKDHFIPHPGNDHHPHVLKHHVLFGYSAILILLKILAVTVSFGVPQINLQATAITPNTIISLVNQARTAAGIAALQVNDRLTNAAAAKAQDMLANQYFAHTSPDGVTPWHWIIQSGYSYEHSAENLAVHYQQAEDVQASWIASPSHKKNILNSDFQDTGVAIATGQFEGYDTIFVVQMFGRPITAQIIPGIVEPASAEPLEVETVTQDPKPTPPQVKGEESIADIKLQPEAQGYAVVAEEKTATNIQVAIGTTDIPLTKKDSDTWTGGIIRLTAETPPNIPIPVSGNITQPDGLTTEQPVAWVMPGSNLPAFYFSNVNTAQNKLFGIITRQDIQKAIQLFYLFLLVFLLGSLTLYIFIRFHIQNIQTITHTLGVIGLIVLLLMI